MRPAPLDWNDLPGAPAEGTPLAAMDDIAPGAAKVLSYRDGPLRFEAFLQRIGDEIFAYENSCPHARLPLDVVEGRFLDVSKQFLLCANHGARFRVRDGFCVSGPCKGQYLRSLPIRIMGRRIIAGS